MAKPLTTFAVNDRVVHAVFGDGTIASTNAQYTVVGFDSAGTRKFVTKMLQVERSTVAAPEKPVKKAAKKKSKA